VTTLDVLPAIVDAVGDRIAVLFDSGIRTGAHVATALALGARAVLIGRPFVAGLALGGRPGVEHVLRSLLAEFDLAVGMMGYAGYRDMTPSSLHHVV
jgi:lactate 2-monooxygenase